MRPGLASLDPFMHFSDQDKQNQRLLSEAAAEFLTFAEGDARCRSLEGFAPFYEATRTYLYPLQAWPTLVRPALAGAIAEMTLSVDRLVKTVFERIFKGDLDKICAFYNVEDQRDLADMVFMEPTGIDAAISRQDCMITADGPMCMEMNCGSFVGAWEISCIADAIIQSPPVGDFIRERGLEVTCPDAVKLVFDHLVEAALALPNFRRRELNVAITASAHLDDKNNRAYINGVLNQGLKRALADKAPGLRGSVIICKTSQLKASGSKLYVKGKQIHAMFEQHDHTRPTEAFRCAKGGGLALFSGPITLFLSDKRNLALLSENQDTGLYDEEDSRLIRKYIPWTRILTKKDADYQGETVYLPDFVLQSRDKLVIKAAQGLGGDDVFVGRSTPVSLWEEKVAEALETGMWIVQERIDAPTLQYMDKSGVIRPHHLVLGMFAVGGSFGGGVLRVMPVADTDVVNMKQGANLSLLLVVNE